MLEEKKYYRNSIYTYFFISNRFIRKASIKATYEREVEFLLSKRKRAVKPTRRQNSAVLKASLGKF